jgi:hypothetical protein
MRSADTSELAAHTQLEVYRRMSPSERLRVGLELTELSRSLLIEGIRRRHPMYSAEQLRLAAIRAWLGTEDFRRAFPDAPELDP